MQLLVGPPRGVVLVLPCPRTGRPKRFLVSPDDAGSPCLFELLRVAPSTPASFFVDQTVVSSGALLVASVYDPLFLLLPRLVAAGGAPMSLEDLLDAAAVNAPQSAHALRCASASSRAALEAVCDVEPADGSGGPRSFRLSQAKAVAVLARKVRRLAEALGVKADATARRLRQSAGAFSTTSSATVVPPRRDPGGSEEAEDEASVPLPRPLFEAHLPAALSCVCEYLSDAWVPALTVACG